MPLITQSIPNLIGGVSQQSPAVRDSNQCEVMENAFPSPIEGLIKRPPASKIAEFRKQVDSSILSLASESDAKPHLIIRDVNEKYICLIHPDEIFVYNLDGTRQNVYYDTGAKNYLTGGTRDTIKALTIADVTFIVNTATSNSSTVVAMDASTTTSINYDRIALVFIKQDNYARSISVTLTNSAGSGTVTYTHDSPKDATGNHNIGTDHVAKALATLINGQENYTAVAVDGVLKITRNTNFTISVEDDFGGQGAAIIRDQIQRFEDLPYTASHNHVVRVLGAPESGIDDYYVKFEAEDGTFSKGIWRETIAPGIKYKFNYGTMPHILIRQSDGSFMFKKADGTTPASNVPAGVTYTSFKWADRAAGDLETNSDPTFVGDRITNMVLFKNRLGFLSGENIILSEASEFFNFWRTTTLDLPDSDPIDISSSSQKISTMKSGVVFNTELLLFTESTQLVLRGGEILSPKSVSLLPIGDYESYADIQPVSSGLSVFFPYNRGGGYAGIRELVPQPNIDGSYVVNAISDLVPKYIFGKPVTIASTTQEDMMAAVSGGDLYLYKYLRTSEQSLQNAWFKFTFPDVATGGKAKVIWAEFVDSYLYLLTLRNDAKNPVLERIRFGVDQTDADIVPGVNWLTHLDARQYFASGTGTYNSGTGLTTWNLPKPYSYNSTLSQIYTTNGLRILASSGTSYNANTDTAGTIVAVGNYSTTPVWIGYKYEMVFQFSNLWLPSRALSGTAALQTGRYQLKHMNLLYEDTSFFKIQVTVGVDQAQYEYVYTGNIVGSSVLNQIYLDRGSFRFPVYGKNTETTIKILNDSPLPCKIISAEVEADYTDRAQRFA